MIRTLAATLVAATAAVSVAQAEIPNPLTFGIISTESSQALKSGFDPFLADMEKALGVKVNAFFAPDYAGVIEAMRFKKVDLAWFGNKAAMEAVDRAGGEVFVQTVDVTGNPGYWSLIIANKDNTKINSLEDVLKCDQTLNFANGDPNSTSGYLVPAFYVFAKNNVDPKKCFKTVRNANHESNALAVANKQVDIATNNTENLYGRLLLNNKDAAEKIKVIWKSPLIPADPIVWRGNLDREDKGKLKAFFLSYGRTGPNAAKEREVLAKVSSGWAPFQDSSNAQLYPIRLLELAKNRAKIEGDDRLAAAEKAKDLADIDAKIALINTLESAQGAIGN